MAAHEKEYGHYAQPSFKSLKSLDLELFSKADLIYGRYRSVSSAQFVTFCNFAADEKKIAYKHY